jgi:hypothetical protein
MTLRGEFGSTMLEAGVPMHEVRTRWVTRTFSMTPTYLRTRTNSLDTAYARRASHMKLVKNRKAANRRPMAFVCVQPFDRSPPRSPVLCSVVHAALTEPRSFDL